MNQEQLNEVQIPIFKLTDRVDELEAKLTGDGFQELIAETCKNLGISSNAKAEEEEGEGELTADQEYARQLRNMSMEEEVRGIKRLLDDIQYDMTRLGELFNEKRIA